MGASLLVGVCYLRSIFPNVFYTRCCMLLKFFQDTAASSSKATSIAIMIVNAVSKQGLVLPDHMALDFARQFVRLGRLVQVRTDNPSVGTAILSLGEALWAHPKCPPAPSETLADEPSEEARLLFIQLMEAL